MIQRLYINDYLNFKEVNIELIENLIVFSGISGAGKSVLLNAILGVLGFVKIDAKKIEIDVKASIKSENFGIEDQDINTFATLNQSSQRFFINNQNISKKNINLIANDFVDYLSIKNYKEFENTHLLNLLDTIISNQTHTQNLQNLKNDFNKLKTFQTELNTLQEKEKNLEDTKEFLRFEIEKIESIDPKVGEFDELMDIKKSLSKKEKILQVLESAKEILHSEHNVNTLLELTSNDSTLFNESMSELSSIFEDIQTKYEDLNEDDIENILDRIEKLSSLRYKYGSITGAIEAKKEKQNELKKYENITYEKQNLEENVKKYENQVNTLNKKIQNTRVKNLPKLQNHINKYLKDLYLNPCNIKLEEKEPTNLGIDSLVISINNTKFDKLSSGEFNRLRLSIIATSSDILKSGGVLILDEVDANLSGKESESIANILLKLSKTYQVLAISHQPQLSAKAKKHFVVDKTDNKSIVKELSKDERIQEIARMVSGKDITDEALSLANKLLDTSKKNSQILF